jgi:hypothetical protein
MRWLRFAIAGVLVGCAAEDSGDDTNSTFTASTMTTPGTSDGDDSTTAPADDDGTTALTLATESSGASDGPVTLDSGESSSSGGGVDCTAPTDCASCWDCAAQGPCMAQYMSCQAMFNCIPSLSCIDSMCTADGLTQDCTTTCCISCTDLGTCPMVDGVVSCIETQCAGLCGDVSCG